VVNENNVEADGFLSTLAALKQVIQPSDELHKQVHVLQKENRTLFEKLEHLRQESSDKFQALQLETQEKLNEQRSEWEQRLKTEQEQSAKERSEFEADLESKTARLEEMAMEKRVVVERVEDERRVLEESMIELENENKELKERFVKSEAMGSKLQAEVRSPFISFVIDMSITDNVVMCIYMTCSSMRERTHMSSLKWQCKKHVDFLRTRNRMLLKSQSTNSRYERHNHLHPIYNTSCNRRSEN